MGKETAIKCDICNEYNITHGKKFFHVFERIKGEQRGATAQRYCESCFSNR